MSTADTGLGAKTGLDTVCQVSKNAAAWLKAPDAAAYVCRGCCSPEIRRGAAG